MSKAAFRLGASVLIVFASACDTRNAPKAEGLVHNDLGVQDVVDLPSRPTLGRGVDIVAVVSTADDGVDSVEPPDKVLSGLVRELKRRKIDYRLGITSSTVDRDSPGMCWIKDHLRRGDFVQPPGTSFPSSQDWSGPRPPPPILSPMLEVWGNVEKLIRPYAATALDTPYCEMTQYLEAALLATDGRNAHFPRKDALLVLLIMSTREDCSTAAHNLWDRSNGWPDNVHMNARCTRPPAKLLQPIGGMVDRLLGVHSSGPILTYIVGSRTDPVFELYGSHAEWVKPECIVSDVAWVMPATRLVQFVSDVSDRAVSGVDAIFDDKMCEAVKTYTDAGIAGRLVKAIVERIQ